MTDREALLHYFELEYFEEDLLLVRLNTIPEGEHIDLSIHGFTKDGLPETKDAVRIDMVGGFVLQNINPTRCYFRAILNMDIKVDFVPPSLINFISRQLMGNGHKLFQKAVASVATTDEDYREALKGQMYIQAREVVDPSNKSKTMVEDIKVEEKSADFLIEEYEDGKSLTDTEAMDNSQINEIEEEEDEHGLYPEANEMTSGAQECLAADHKHHSRISPEVENALNTLDEAIAIFRDLRSPHGIQIEGLSLHSELQISEKVEEATSLNGTDELQSYAIVKPPGEAVVDSPVIEKFRYGDPTGRQSGADNQHVSLPSPNKSVGSDESRSRTSSNQMPTDANATGSGLTGSPRKGPADAGITRSQQLTLDRTSKVLYEVSSEVNGARGSGRYEVIPDMKKKKKQGFCCLSFN